MILVFFDNEGLIYTNYVPKSQMVKANYMVDALSKFLATFKKKRPNMVAQEWFFHWDNAPVHTAAIVKDWMAARDFRLIDHLPYSWTSHRRTFSYSRLSKGSWRAKP
jgi:hypothetical protein